MSKHKQPGGIWTAQYAHCALGRPILPFPPPPQLPVPSRRLVTVLRGRANTWTSFQQLDGEAEETPSPPSPHPMETVRLDNPFF